MIKESVPEENQRRGMPLHPAVKVAIILLGLILIILLLLPSLPLGSSHESAPRISCASNLKQIGLALMMYSDDWKSFPPLDGAAGLELLRSQGYLENPRMYLCHETNSRGMGGFMITEITCDYQYWGGYTEVDLKPIPIACDKPNNHRNYGNVVFIDRRDNPLCPVQGYSGKDWEDIQSKAKAMHLRIVGQRREKMPDPPGGE